MKYLLGAVCCTALLFTVSCAHKAQDSTTIKPKAEAPKKAEETQPQKAEAPLKAFTCIVNKDTRIIELDKTPKRCEVHYTKFGDKAQVAWAEATPNICSDVFSRIRDNIESKGFKCTEGTAQIDKTDQQQEKEAKSQESDEHKQKEATKDSQTASRDKASITQ